ncbi:uncharacterized protein BDV17DRAFT_264591 [Aspergillus undulatus]|uniref:uncharacterized protein n=1 Tax=Aspergillus undulatus TaxID=1810928 RepID=UPI003CCDFCEE
MYRRSFSRSPRSRSRSRSASLPGGYPRLPLHRTHIPRKGIIKPPTQKDDEMLIRNLWTMVALAEQRMDYTYEFLSGVLLIGDDILDTILKAGELSMFEEASRHARRMEERQRAREEEAFRPTKIPVPLKQYSSRSKWEVPKHARSEKRSLPVSAKSSPVGSGMDILEEAEEER